MTVLQDCDTTRNYHISDPVEIKKYGLTTGESEEVDEELIDHESHRLG